MVVNRTLRNLSTGVAKADRKKLQLFSFPASSRAIRKVDENVTEERPLRKVSTRLLRPSMKDRKHGINIRHIMRNIFDVEALPDRRLVQTNPAGDFFICHRPIGREHISRPKRKHELELSSFYLRDHCSCPECQHPETKQRLVDTFSIPEDIKPKEFTQTKNGVTVIWENDGHKSYYSWAWLKARNSSPNHPFNNTPSLWDANIAQNPPTIDYASVMKSDDGVKEWTSLIRKWGFCYVDGCPVSGEATQELIERIAFIRPTHYGGFWQFTADLAKKDSAYTQLALGAHTDTTYFNDPAGLQTFHLLSHTDGEGGASLLVDGFKAAQILKQESPDAYKALVSIKIRAHASGNENVKLATDLGHPVLTESRYRQSDHRLTQVRWNNDDRAALNAHDPLEVKEFYAAARKWAEIIKRPELEYWEQLKPGRPLIFDNWRVLHGRSAFTGRREMCGAYTNMDDFISRWKTLNFSPEEIENSV